jgi:hypothetical protein
MLVFPEIGKGTDQPTLSTNLLERSGQCLYVQISSGGMWSSNDLLTVGSLKYCHFSLPVTAQDDWIRPQPHNTYVGEIVWEGLGGWKHMNSRQVSVTSMRQDTCNGVLISMWKFADQFRSPVFLQIQNWFVVLSSVLNLTAGRAKYSEFK